VSIAISTRVFMGVSIAGSRRVSIEVSMKVCKEVSIGGSMMVNIGGVGEKGQKHGG